MHIKYFGAVFPSQDLYVIYTMVSNCELLGIRQAPVHIDNFYGVLDSFNTREILDIGSFFIQNKLISKNIELPIRIWTGYMNKFLAGMIIGNKAIAATGGNINFSKWKTRKTQTIDKPAANQTDKCNK